MKQLIITADDYGMSLAVNQAIQEGIDNGIITSTNVMMNMPFCDDTHRILAKKASIGLHWNLTCGKSILSYNAIPSLVNKDGDFYSISDFRRLYKSGMISNADIEKELIAQYERFHDVWGEPDYWNSHENVHLGLKIHKVFLRIAAQVKINKMRSHDRIYVPSKSGQTSSSIIWILMEPIKKIIFTYWKKESKKMGILSPDGKICCLDEKDAHDLRYIISNIRWKHNQIAEFTIHPATQIDSPFFGGMTENRIIEYKMTIDPEIRQMIEYNDISLASFDAVK